jgi:hypothetical protein
MQKLELIRDLNELTESLQSKFIVAEMEKMIMAVIKNPNTQVSAEMPGHLIAFLVNSKSNYEISKQNDSKRAILQRLKLKVFMKRGDSLH